MKFRMTADAWQALPDDKRKKHMMRFTKNSRCKPSDVKGVEGWSLGKCPKRQRDETRTKVKKAAKTNTPPPPKKKKKRSKLTC